jgi:hypothetical protein
MTKSVHGPQSGPVVGRAGTARGGSGFTPGASTSSSSFGVNDRPKCERCGDETRLSRRRPHPTRGSRYELQSFTCPKCRHVQHRDADAQGAIP